MNINEIYYYLINNKIMSGYKMPNKTNYGEIHNVIGFDRWLSSLKPCEISESELAKIIHTILVNNTDVVLSSPIEVTDIISDNNGVITFKHPKQVDGEIEAVEFAEWITQNCQMPDSLPVNEIYYCDENSERHRVTIKQLYTEWKQKKI